jgi:ATP-dependent helicase/DNAse subunit B
VEEGAYSSSENVFFSDFYSDAAEYLYSDILNTLKSDVYFSDSFDEIDILEIPYLEEFYVRSWN